MNPFPFLLGIPAQWAEGGLFVQKREPFLLSIRKGLARGDQDMVFIGNPYLIRSGLVGPMHLYRLRPKPFSGLCRMVENDIHVKGHSHPSMGIARGLKGFVHEGKNGPSVHHSEDIGIILSGNHVHYGAACGNLYQLQPKFTGVSLGVHASRNCGKNLLTHCIPPVPPLQDALQFDLGSIAG